jgi:hypothetical protein
LRIFLFWKIFYTKKKIVMLRESLNPTFDGSETASQSHQLALLSHQVIMLVFLNYIKS